MQGHLVRSSCALFLVAVVMAIATHACSARVGPTGGGSTADDGDAGYGGSFPALQAPASDEGDDRARPSTTPSTERGDDDGEVADVGVDPAEGDASAAIDPMPDGACTARLAPGDLAIDELMIASVAGSGDDGEWFEVTSTVACTSNLGGLHGECPHGSKVSTFDVSGDLWLPPHGTFVVADSSDPAINHALPGLLVVWLGHTGDVLRNEGSTLTLSFAGTLIDTVTYPSLPASVGASLAFPSACDAGLRSDFTRWKRSTASWFPGFFGTPNAPNSDLDCP
jgi:hypothetical protein